MEGQIKLSNEDTNEEEYSVSILMNFPQCSNSTVLGSLIGNTQCENFRIFLPLRFYMELILVVLKFLKAAILTI